MLQKYSQMKILVSSFGCFFHDQLPICLRLCPSLHNNTSRNIYAATKAFKTADKELHCFKNLYPWKTSSDFANHLKSSIVYNEGGLVVLNKPYGVRIHQQKKNEGSKVHRSATYASHEDFPYSVEECLPDLKHHLNFSDLQIIKSAERFSSGIVLLGSNEAVVKKVRKSQNIAKHEKIPPYIFWAVTNGNPPLHQAMRQKVGIKLVDLQHNGETQPVIVMKPSRRQILDKKVKSVIVEHRIIGINKETSSAVLEVATSSMSLFFLRVYASSQVCGILGDTMYGPRMQKLLGQPIHVSPENLLAFDVQPLPELLCQRLDLPHSVSGHLVVPTMLHFRTVVLPRYLKNKDLIINAPAPPHFAWTCSRLDFTLPD